MLTAKNTHVKQGDILTISSYYECGDNLLDAIYTLGETILDNNKVDINPACSNQGIILLLNNKTYTSKSNKSGIVIFKIKTKKIPVGNHTYIIYHEDNEYYTDIFNSSDIEIIKKEEKLTKNTHESKNKNKTPKTEKLKYLKTSPKKDALNHITNQIKTNNPINLQKENYEPYIPIKKENYENCGAKTLQKLISAKGIYVPLDKLIKKLNTKNGQTTMQDMINVAKEYNIQLYGNKIELENLNKGDIALITINNSNHFVSIISFNEDYITYEDPDLGMITSTISEFESIFSGKYII